MHFFSLHPNVNDIGNHALYAKGFTVRIYNHIWDLAIACTEKMNSPAVWQYGIRKKENVAFSEFAVLD